MILNVKNETNIYDVLKHNGFKLNWLDREEAKKQYNNLKDKRILLEPTTLKDIARQFMKDGRIYLFSQWVDNGTKVKMIDITNII